MSGASSDLRAVERGIVAVEAIQQVVAAVWTLARAQQGRVENAANQASAYLEWVEDLVARFAGEPLDATDGRVLWIVIGPERSFCGGFARRVFSQIPTEGSLLIVGRRLAEAVPIAGAVQNRIVASMPAAAGPEEIDSCTRQIASALLELDHSGPIVLLHPAQGSGVLRRVPLFFSAVSRESAETPETYSRVSAVMEAALLEALSGRLLVGLAEALRSEVRARLLAADSARQGCSRKLETLQQQWRVERQESITSEILELYSARLSNEV